MPGGSTHGGGGVIINIRKVGMQGRARVAAASLATCLAAHPSCQTTHCGASWPCGCYAGLLGPVAPCTHGPFLTFLLPVGAWRGAPRPAAAPADAAGGGQPGGNCCWSCMLRCCLRPNCWADACWVGTGPVPEHTVPPACSPASPLLRPSLPAWQWSQGARLRTVDEELPEAPSATLDARQQQQQQQADAQGGQDVPEGVTYERPMSRESAGSSDGSGPSDSAQSMHTQLGSLPKASRGRDGCSGCFHGQSLPCTAWQLVC